MMKSTAISYYAFIFMLGILMLVHPLFWGQTIKLTVLADKVGAEVVLQYHLEDSSEIKEKKTKVNKEKAANFLINGKVLSDFTLLSPEDVSLTAVKIKGRKNLRIEPVTDEIYHIKMEGRSGIYNYYAFFLVAAFSYYLFYFGRSVWENRQQPRETERLPKMLNFEFLRVIFTFGVVWCHCAMPLKIWQASWLGVEFFFLLSGFLFCLTFNSQKSLIDFMLGKIVRFSPLIIFGALLCLARRNDFNAQMFFADVFLFARTGIVNTDGYNGAAWYLSVLFWVLVFYYVVLKNFSLPVARLLIGVVVFFGCVYVANYGDSFKFIFNGRLLRGFACVGLGYFLAGVYKSLEGKTIRNYRLYSWCEAGVLFYAVTNIFVRSFYQGRITTCIFFMALILMFALRKGAVSQWFEKAVWARIAKYVLAVYLTHGFFTGFLYMEPLHTFVKANQIWMLPVIFACIISFGIFAHYAVEKPASRVLKKIFF